MGQYWKVFNLDKKEKIEPHNIGCGLKLWEQVASHPGTGTALLILLANMPESRGGGDLKENEKSIKVIGRWAGDRIAIIGDYAEKDDLDGWDTENIYGDETYIDISEMVAKVIEAELGGKYIGDGWKNFEYNKSGAY